VAATPNIERIAMWVTIAGGLATLFYLDTKRRGKAGDDCTSTDDCRTGTHCVRGTCEPDEPTGVA